MKLYEIAAQYRELDRLLDEWGGEVTPEIAGFMDALEGELTEKVDAIGALVREAEAEVEAFRGEAARLATRARVAANKADRLKAFLLDALKAAGKEKVEGKFFSAAPRRAGVPAITWPGDPLEIPVLLRKVAVSVDGKAAQAALKANELPGGFRVAYSEFLDLR